MADTTKSHPYWATTTDNERAKEWLMVFGSIVIPVTSPQPVQCYVEGIGVTEVYLLALDMLTDDELMNVVHHIASKWHEDVQLVFDELHRQGLPVLAANVTVTTLPAPGQPA